MYSCKSFLWTNGFISISKYPALKWLGVMVGMCVIFEEVFQRVCMVVCESST